MNWQHPPKIVQFDITGKCNLNCHHCRASNLDRTINDLSYYQIIDFLDQIHSFAPNVALAVAGGEPLIRKDLKEIFYHIKNNLPGMSIELLTNGMLVNEQNIEWLIDTVSGFNISLEGSTAEIHDKIRGSGAFNKTVETIKLLVNNNATMAVRMTYFGQDEEESIKLMHFVYNLGVKIFNFRYLVPVGNAQGEQVDPIQYKRLCERVWETGQELGMTVGFSDPFPEFMVNKKKLNEITGNKDLSIGKAVTGCSIAFTLLYLNPQGIVELCPYYPIVVEDAKKKKLRDIWFDNELLHVFRQSRAVLEGKCGDCEFKFACGGCRGAAQAIGNSLGDDPRCWKSEAYC